MQKSLIMFCCTFSIALPLFSQSIYVEANGGGRLSLTQITIDEGKQLENSNKWGGIYGGKLGIVGFISNKKKKRMNTNRNKKYIFALSGELGYAIRENTFNFDLKNMKVNLPYQMQSYSFGLKPILRPAKRFYVVAPIAISYNTFDLFRQIETDYSNPELQTFYTIHSLRRNSLGISLGIGVEWCFSNDNKSYVRNGIYKGVRVGFLLNYSQLFNPIHEFDITYKLNDSDYKRAIANSNAQGIEGNLYILVPIQIRGGNGSHKP